jgi:D-apiose dehydrogenase
VGDGKDGQTMERFFDVTKLLRGVAVGTGYFSQYHYEAWNRVAGAEIVALASLDSDQANDMAARHNIPVVYDDIALMLARECPDFIDIISPPETHSAIVKLAGEFGIDVLCQKALTPTYAEAEAMVAGAEASGIRLMVHDNFRFQPWHREIRRLIDDGAIGDLQSIICHSRFGDGWGEDPYLGRQPYFRTMPRLLIYETGVHFIDVFRFLGGEISAVFAHMRQLNPLISGEDCVLLFCEFSSGAIATWDANRYHESPHADPRYTFGEFLIEGSNGTLRLDGDGKLYRRTLGEDVEEHQYSPSRSGFAGDSVYATLCHFVERLNEGAPFETEGRDYLRTLAVQEAAYRAAEKRSLTNPKPPFQ